MIILLALVILFSILEFTCKKLGWNEWETVFERLRVLFRWNIPIMLIATNLGDIIFFTSLEFQNPNFDSAVGRGSLTICIITLLLCALVLLLAVLTASKAHITRKNAIHQKSFGNYSNFLTQFQGLQVLFRGFRDDKPICSYFYLIYVIRIALPHIIAAALYISPLLQSILYSLISLTFILFLIDFKPIKKKINLIQIIYFELLIMIVNGCVLLLTFFDHLNTGNRDTQIFLCDVIIFINFCINIFPIIFFIIKLITMIQAAIRTNRKIPNNSRVLWLQLLFLPIQQQGFGFEQVQISRFSDGYTRLANRIEPLTIKRDLIIKDQVIRLQDESGESKRGFNPMKLLRKEKLKSIRRRFRKDEVIEI